MARLSSVGPDKFKGDGDQPRMTEGGLLRRSREFVRGLTFSEVAAFELGYILRRPRSKPLPPDTIQNYENDEPRSRWWQYGERLDRLNMYWRLENVRMEMGIQKAQRHKKPTLRLLKRG